MFETLQLYVHVWGALGTIPPWDNKHIYFEEDRGY